MDKKLVIVESPAKAKTIGKFLGDGYVVKASKGHIRDLPTHSLGVDVENGFKPKYELSQDRKQVVSELKAAAKGCDEIFLAPDPDREGEAIAWHLYETLLPVCKKKPFHRVQYNEVTPNAVKEAFAHPGEIDMNRVNAQQARRVLDRIVGYMVSPLLWKRFRNKGRSLSAGRVQSVALRLLAEREREIKAFKPEEYWVVGAKVQKKGKNETPFAVRLNRLDGKKSAVGSAELAKEIEGELRNASLCVKEIKTREVSRHALPPFITSTLQQAASNALGFSPSRTMSLAQGLYEGGSGGVGLITYMRTDSVNLSKDAREAAQKFITENYGTVYFAQNYYKSRGSAQEAHEAIRPTDVNRTPESLAGKLDPAALKLYDLIWRRFVASLMPSAKVAQKTIYMDVQNDGLVGGTPRKHEYTFTASSSEILFDGFLKVMHLDIRKQDKDNEEESDEVENLPALAEGDWLDVLEPISERKETKPPARYSEASLVKALEANGVGRPSTYAATVETLVARNYAEREKRQLVPTELGLNVSELLVEKLPDLFDVGFTAQMEQSLDEVEEGGEEWQRMLTDFYQKFSKWLENAAEPPADPEKVKAILALCSSISQWQPPLKKGRRTLSDQEFIERIRGFAENGNKITVPQLAALVALAVRYRSQIPDGDNKLAELGYSEQLEKDKAAPDQSLVARRFELLDGVELGDRQKKFLASLRRQSENGRKLSEKQLQIIDEILLENQGSIPNFDAVKEELHLETTNEQAPTEEDKTSPVLVAMLENVKEWSEPLKRGKRTFDDAEFCKSISDQYKRKKSLSPKQVFALKRLCWKYRAQIPDFDARANELGLIPKSKKTDAKAEEEK